MRDCAKEYFFMAKVDTIVTSLQKLQAKRSALDKQIIATEKKLVGEVKNAAAKPAAKTRKTTAKKTTTRKRTSAK